MPIETTLGTGTSASARRGPGCLRVFCLPFVAIGFIAFYILTLKPILQVIESGNWVETPCVILSSGLHESRSSKSNSSTYRVEVSYRYTYEGQSYEAARYQFGTASTGGRKGKEAIVAGYQPGTQTTCFVNPQSPREAVLVRTIPNQVWFGLIPLLFVAFGVVLFVIAPRLAANPTGSGSGPIRTRGVRKRDSAEFTLHFPAGPTSLKSASSPMAKLIGMICFALFWNGIVSVFVWQVIKGFQRGRPEWFLTLFIIPFVLIGIGFLFGIVYSALNLLNPRVEVFLSDGHVRLGDSLKAEWSFNGRTNRIRRLVITLEGKELATYRRGTKTATDEHVFHRVELFQTDSPAEIPFGQLSLNVPAGSMHSFRSSNNEISWKLMIKGEVPWFPDVADEFAIPVLPRNYAPTV